MKFSCLQENLAKGVQIVYRAVPTKSPLPILTNILLSAKNNNLTLSASNMETTIITNVGASVETAGAITIPAKLIKDFVSNLQADTLDAILENSILQIKSEKTVSRFNGSPAEDFPELPKVPETPSKILLTPDVFSEMVSSVAFSAGTISGNPVYTGIYIKYDGKKLIAVASDGYRLSEITIPYESEAEAFETLIPAKTLVEVARIFSEKEAPIHMTLNRQESLVLFSTEDTVIATRILDGQYPDYTRIIPKETVLKATFATEELLEAVRLTSVFSSKEDNKAVRIKCDPSGVIQLASVSDETGKHESQISGEVEGDALELTFNAKYLLDFLGNAKTESIVLETNGVLTPCMFRKADTPSYFHIIMPMQI